MPCHTVQKTQVEFGKKTDAAILAKALDALALGPQLSGSMLRFGKGEWFDLRNGTMSVLAARNVSEIKREYVKQVVLAQASKAGFRLVPSSDSNRKEITHVRI